MVLEFSKLPLTASRVRIIFIDEAMKTSCKPSGGVYTKGFAYHFSLLFP